MDVVSDCPFGFDAGLRSSAGCCCRVARVGCSKCQISRTTRFPSSIVFFAKIDILNTRPLALQRRTLAGRNRPALSRFHAFVILSLCGPVVFLVLRLDLGETMNRRRLVCVTCAAVLMAGFAASAIAGVFSGSIHSVSSSSKKIAVRATTSKTVKNYKISSSTRITLDGKKTTLRRLKAGYQISVFTSKSGRVTKISARSKSPSEPSTPTPKKKKSASDTPDTPKPSTPKKSARSKRSTKSTVSASGKEWHQFRGSNRDNVSPDKGLLQSWPSSGPRGLWIAKGMGEGYSSVSISNGLVYTMGNSGRSETVFAVSLQNGETAWKARSGNASRLSAGNGPRSTPTIDGDAVYTLGGNGDLSCIDAKSGDIRWQKNILRDFRANNIGWGICESVLIDGDKLICTPGGPGATMVALDKQTGDVIWRSAVPGNPQASYASAIVAVVGGVRQYITFTSRSVIGVKADNGVFLWQESSPANGTANCSTPLFYQNHVFAASGYGTGGALFRLQSSGGRTASREVFFTRKMKNHHGGMVIVDGYLYGSDEAVLTCINLQNGQVMWQNRSVGKGSVTFADGHIYLRSEGGPVALVEANTRQYREKGRFNQPQRSGRSAWPHPVVADGKLFLRDQDNLFCYDLRSR